ncbi:hypothetical protein BJX64DRAFT_283153 [Aspergillus heterothallicus]
MRKSEPSRPTQSSRKRSSGGHPKTIDSWANTSLNLSERLSHKIKAQIMKEADRSCFLCDEEQAGHCAHVLPYADHQRTQILKGRGLVNFRLGSEQNRVGLCPNCHTKYDNHSDPQAMFYPCNLEYFVRFELRDRHRRAINGNTVAIRQVPTAAQYAARCGGLYTRMRFYFRNGELIRRQKAPKAWHGAPIAALHRAMAIVGSSRAERIPVQDTKVFRILWDVYFRDDPDILQPILEEYWDGTDPNFGLGEVPDCEEGASSSPNYSSQSEDSSEEDDEDELGRLRKMRKITHAPFDAHWW